MAERERNRDIRNILTVLGASVICAALLASVFLYYYNPSGRYLAGNTLLDPSIMDQIFYQDQHPNTGKTVRFAFDRIEFSNYDPQLSKIEVFPISRETYQRFYNRVASDKSLEEVTKSTQSFFLQPHPAFLTVQMRTKEREGNGAVKIFQIVQFVSEGYFRIQLREKNEGEWVYFYRPGLYQEIIHLFTQKNMINEV